MKKLLSIILVLGLVLSCTCSLPFTATAAGNEGKVTNSTLSNSPLLDDLMAEYTSFVVVKHKQLGASHYAYTESLSDEFDANSPDGVETSWRPGSQLVLLELEKNGSNVKKTETVLIESTTGVIRDPDVSEDGTVVLFSWKKAQTDDYHLYEYDLKTKETKQLTFGSGVADTEPKYLPDGKIVFSSSRVIQTIDCWITPVSNLYVCDADGGNIVRVGYDQVHTTYPTLTSDGRVIYTRWDYNDRNQMFIQGVFQMFPDGTNQTELYGNNSNFPTTLLHTREVPGTSDKYISVASGHHTWQAGKLVILDTSIGRNDKDAVSFVFPDSNSSKGDSIDGYGQNGALYKYPYALNENQFLVSYSANGWGSNRENTPFGIYLMDTSGTKIELVSGSDIPASQIVPVASRTMFERATMVNYGKDTGTYYIGNIYEGDGLKDVPVGEAKYLRVVEIVYREYAIGATVASGTGSSDPYSPIATGNGAWDVKNVLGIVPIEEDGSVLFEVPSETPVYFQVMNADGDVIQSMRSWSTLMPGETFSCVGCHEDKNTVPPAASTTTLAMAKGVQKLQPDFWQTGEGYEDFDPYETEKGFDYLEEVQTIFDDSCIECHSNVGEAYDAINVGGMPGADSTVKSTVFDTDMVWKYAYGRQSGTGWRTTDFDDSSWLSGKGPFGANTSLPYGTPWTEDDIYLRGEFELNKYQLEDLVLSFDVACVEFPRIYINGTLVYTGRISSTEYTTVEFDDKMKEALTLGTNTIAVSASKSSSGTGYFALGMKGQQASVEDEIEVVSTNSTWSYRKSATNNPPSGWNSLGFDASSWAVAQAPFGDRTGYKTSWAGNDKYIWILKTFNIENVEEFKNCEIILNTWYDDNPVFYLNGNRIFTDTEGNAWVDEYTTINLGTGFSKYLVEGQNVFAIECSNDVGGRMIDSSMVLRKNTKASTTLVPTNADGWKYVIDSEPASNWMNTDFGDSAWRTGKAGFGDGGSTSWSGENTKIWLRKTFTIDDISTVKNMKLYLDIKYDQDPVVYINGTEVFSASAHIGDYKRVGLLAEYTNLLKEGENVIAIHARNAGGGLYIDSGLTAIEIGGSPVSLESTNIVGTRMKKFMPLSYLVLTGSAPNGSNWVGNSTNAYTNWISSMSQCEMLEPYAFGAANSNIIKKLRAGHGGLTDTQIRKIAAWIDLGVPCYGEYDANTSWGSNEVRWAQEYSNKRSFYTLMNDYTRLALASGGTIAGEAITATYTASGNENYTESSAGIVVLNVPKSYAAGETITITLPKGETYAMISLNSKMGEELVYCPNGTFTYTIPSGMNAYPASFARFTENVITARVATDSELSERRNLAENAYDLSNASGIYPHATTDSNYNNQAEFTVRNAIDGFTANTGHGNYPVQSWGPDHGSHWMQVDFGKEVYVDEVSIYIRADFPHDVHYTSATLEFSDGTKQDIVMTRTAEAQVFTFDTKLTSYVKITNLVPADTNTALWSGITEFQVFGSINEPGSDAPTTTWTLDDEKDFVTGIPVSTDIETFRDGFSTDVSVKSGTTEVTRGYVGTGMTVDFNGKTYTAIVLGDLNGDGVANVVDVVALRQAIMNGKYTGVQKTAGDITGDDLLNVSDVVALRQMIMG